MCIRDRQGQSLALGHVRCDLRVVDVGAQLIGHQHHHNIASLGSLFDLHDFEVVVSGGELGGLCPVGRALAQTDNNVHAALGQVLGMGVALAAEADDSDGLAVQHAEVVMMLVPDELCADIYNTQVAPYMTEGKRCV